MRQIEAHKLPLCLIIKIGENEIQRNLKPQIFIINEHVWIFFHKVIIKWNEIYNDIK